MALSPNSLDLVARLYLLQNSEECQRPHRVAAGSQNSVPSQTGSCEALGRGPCSQSCTGPGFAGWR